MNGYGGRALWLGQDYWLDQANEGAWFIESKRRIYDDDDWLEPDANTSAAGLVRLQGGNALQTWQNGVRFRRIASFLVENYSFK